MNIKNIINSYLGNKQVNRIYQGFKLVWVKYFGNKYLIGGSFTTPKNKIMRLNDDGSIDNTWSNNSSYTSGAFYELIYDNINKKIYGAGDPALEGGLVRFNLDGTKDNTFNIGTGFNNTVRGVAIDNINSKIYVGGSFTKYNGSDQNRLIRLNMNGSKDTSFNIGSGITAGFSGDVYAINIDTINQKIYVGGSFKQYKGSTRNRLVRLNLDGSLDGTFNVGTLYNNTGFNNTVRALNLDTINQKLYVGGDFYRYKDSDQYYLARLNLNGSKDTSFNIGIIFNSSVYAINIDTINQKIYVGGIFQGNTQNRLIRLNMNGSKDTSFNIGTGFNGEVNSINIDNVNQKIYAGGSFTTFQGSTQNRLIRLNYNGSKDTSFNIQLGSDAITILKYTE